MTSTPSNIVSRYLQRRVLLLSLVPLGVLFAITVTLARTYHARQEGLAKEWFAQGNADLAAGQRAKAFEDFRNALSYDADNNVVQLRLAETLLADGRLTEARSYLLNLWDRTPGSGEVNLDLARLSVRMGDEKEATLYYRNAIFGSWDGDPARRRREVRLELCKFLLAHGETTDAKGELAALAADIPADDVTLHGQTGQLLLQVGEPAKALLEFESMLRTDPRQSEWLEEAGRAAYAAGDYVKAETYLARAVRQNPSDSLLSLHQTARDVLVSDPFQAGLSDQERAQRSWHALQQGMERLQQCTVPSLSGHTFAQPLADLENLNREAQGFKRRINLRTLSQDAESRNETMQFVFRIEELTALSCGTPTGADQALVLIEKGQSRNP